jgi:indolepyruvate ferredoxin oxidoreductase alpha subunit
MARLREYSEKSALNFIEWRDKSLGVITSGISYQYVREALPDASVLKLGMTNPLPEDTIRRFAGEVKRLVVVEELEPFIEDQVKSMGIAVSGKEFVPNTGELDTLTLTRKFTGAGILEPPAGVGAEGISRPDAPAAPGRPPVMCPGCPHRGLFYALKKLKLTVTGDIGCYTLSGLPPLEAMDCCVCMGASIGAAHGMSNANPAMSGSTVAVIGDSTFLHSGITGLLNMVYNNGSGTVVILDNSTTAMTGHQHHPGTGSTLMGAAAPAVDLETLVKALGVKRVRVVNPLDLEETLAAVREETASGEPSVVISRCPCVLLKKAFKPAVYAVKDKCIGCRVCIRLGCPSISVKDKKALVDPVSCTGCGLCIQVAKKGRW